MDVLIFICLLGCMFALVAVLGNQRKIMETLADMQRPRTRGKCECAAPGQSSESIIVAEDNDEQN